MCMHMENAAQGDVREKLSDKYIIYDPCICLCFVIGKVYACTYSSDAVTKVWVFLVISPQNQPHNISMLN